MPELEQVCRRLFSDSSWGVKCLVGGLLAALPILHFFAFGYLGQMAAGASRGEVFRLPEWEEWGVLFVRGVFYFLICAGLTGGLLLAAWILSWPFGWMGPLGWAPFIPAILLAAPLVGAGWYRYSLTENFAEGFCLPELFKLLRAGGYRLVLPTLAYIGLLFAGAPLFPLAFFVGGLVLFYFYCSIFYQVETRGLVNPESSFSVL